VTAVSPQVKSGKLTNKLSISQSNSLFSSPNTQLLGIRSKQCKEPNDYNEIICLVSGAWEDRDLCHVHTENVKRLSVIVCNVQLMHPVLPYKLRQAVNKAVVRIRAFRRILYLYKWVTPENYPPVTFNNCSQVFWQSTPCNIKTTD